MTLEKWSNLTVSEQMANIGAEVGRAINWKDKGKANLSKNCFYRALDLIDLSLRDLNKGHGFLREMARTREIIVDYLFGENEYGSTGESLNKYFLAFNFKARNDK